MEPWASLVSAGIFMMAVTVAGVVSTRAFQKSREESFRRNLRLMGYSKREIDRAVEEQG